MTINIYVQFTMSSGTCYRHTTGDRATTECYRHVCQSPVKNGMNHGGKSSSHKNMISETQYIIFSAHCDNETNTEIIVGEKKFREHAIKHYRERNLEERNCTRYDIEQFLIHHDATYFDEEDRSVFEKVISE